MLRRKLMINLCPLVGLLLITAIAAIALLQGVLRQLDHVNREAWVIVDDVNQLSIAVNATEVDLYEIQLGKQRYLDRLIESIDQTQKLVARIGDNYLVNDPQVRPFYDLIKGRLPEFIKSVGALATVQDERLAREHGEVALSAAVALRQETLPLSRVVREHAYAEQEQLTQRFRWVVLGLGLVFLLLVNFSVLVLVRMASIILRPVDKLVEATRELSHEHFDHRVKLEENDEFDELAESYNTLAEHLQATEKQRMEVISHVALALNHELNNAMATIELQLSLLGRRAGEDPQTERRLHTIHDNLARMKDAVQSLKSIRRIVLTEYGQGMKMLDLAQSMREPQAELESSRMTST